MSLLPYSAKSALSRFWTAAVEAKVVTPSSELGVDAFLASVELGTSRTLERHWNGCFRVTLFFRRCVVVFRRDRLGRVRVARAVQAGLVTECRRTTTTGVRIRRRLGPSVRNTKLGTA